MHMDISRFWYFVMFHILELLFKKTKPPKKTEKNLTKLEKQKIRTGVYSANPRSRGLPHYSTVLDPYIIEAYPTHGQDFPIS